VIGGQKLQIKASQESNGGLLLFDRPYFRRDLFPFPVTDLFNLPANNVRQLPVVRDVAVFFYRRNVRLRSSRLDHPAKKFQLRPNGGAIFFWYSAGTLNLLPGRN
jgi:hypothetical protein